MRTRYLFAVLFSLSVFASDYIPSKNDIDKAKQIATQAAKWFEYTRGVMTNQNMGQCGDYALKFVLDFNKYKNKNVARLVVANNPVESGTYRIGNKINVQKLGFKGFSSGASGFLVWNKKQYLYHPIIGAYEIFLEKAWNPKKHFGVDMTDKRQVHVWGSIGNVSVDPTYYDLWPERFPSPIGVDQ